MTTNVFDSAQVCEMCLRHTWVCACADCEGKERCDGASYYMTVLCKRHKNKVADYKYTCDCVHFSRKGFEESVVRAKNTIGFLGPLRCQSCGLKTINSHTENDDTYVCLSRMTGHCIITLFATNRYYV